MTETQARSVLEASAGVAVFERWMADQPWREVASGWAVAGEFQGWQFQLAEMPGGLQVSATAQGGSPPAVWLVKG